jgi:tetratricopeptide (TPR) repeat protein
LIEEFLQSPSVARCLVLRASCEGDFNAEPLQPFVQVVRSICAEEEAEPGLFDASSHALAMGAAGMRDLFDLLASRGPVVLVIDDWHWADEASQLALDAILGIARPISILLASRTVPDGLASAATIVEVPPLTEEEAAAQVARLLPAADPFMVAEITRYAGGIPLFIEELCHAAAAQGWSGLTNLRGSGRAWLNVMIASRVERLPAPEAELVRAAAVIGSVFPDWLLERITGHGAHSAAMKMLAEKDFIYAGPEPGTQRFKHGITRDAIYETVGLGERKRMHRQIAQTLRDHAQPGDADELLEALAYHCALGGMLSEACDHAERAGDKAMAASALDRARTQYAAALRALDLAAPLDRTAQLRWCAIARKLGLACVFDPLALADGLATFERAESLATQSGDLPALARAQYWLGYLCYAKGLARPAISKCRSALDLALRMNDERFAAQARATLGQALLSACDYDTALGLLDTALEARRRPLRQDEKVAVGPAYSLACKGYLLGDRGHFSGADECFAEALHVLRDVRHQVAASVRHWMSVVLQWQGRWDEAATAADEATSIAMAVRSRQQLAMGQALAGRSRWMVSRDPLALQKIREATAWIASQRGALATSLNHAWIVEGALAQGNDGEARRHAALLLVRARTHDRIGEALGCRALALSAAQAQDFKRARRWLQLSRRSAQLRGSAHEHAANLMCEAQIEIRQGHRAHAEALLDEACSAFEPMRMLWHLEQARLVRAAMDSREP